MGKVVIVEKEHKLLLFLFGEKSRPEMIHMASLPKDEDNLGNIYIGRVTEIAEGIKAAFVAIGTEEKVFLSTEYAKAPMLVNREFDGKLKQGDEVLVQVTTKALKTKLPSADTDLTLTGQYCVCSKSGHGIKFSKKLSEDCTSKLKQEIASADIPNRKSYGFIVRTNAGELTDSQPLLDEIGKFTSFFDELTSKYQYRTLYSCLYQCEPEFLLALNNIPIAAYDEVLTDQDDVFEILKANGVRNPKLYQDDMLSLSALYSLETHLKQALDKKVWLPSGGYLVIEPTEAMVVIDVNSGKGSGEKNAGKKNIYLKTNLEAAKEIARQLRLRNYSGMIMVDFINMEKDADNKQLLKCLDEYLKQDTVKTRLVDMTALGIVEITRKKVSKPLDSKQL